MRRAESRCIPHRPSFTVALLTLAVAALLMPIGASIASHGPVSVPSPTAGASGLGRTPTPVLDWSTLTTYANHRSSTLHDTLVDGGATASSRSYRLIITVSAAQPTVPIRIWTTAAVAWSFPDQFPWGAQALPPLPEWTWWVWSSGVNDTGAWSTNSLITQLSRTASWVNQTYTITGVTHPILNLVVQAGRPDGTRPTSPGFSVNNPGLGAGLPRSDGDLVGLGKALNPGIARFGVTTVGSATSWNVLKGVPKFDFTNFDRTVNYSRSVGAAIVLSISAGTWGDGNLLPTGMPLNLGLPVAYGAGKGFFPTLHAYASYVDAIVNHTIHTRASVLYWTIGNEVPLDSRAVVGGYIQLFNTAASVIHSSLPSAQVGSDQMMNRTYLSQFALNAVGVGFLSFHYYPGNGVCVIQGRYCAPQGGGLGSTDPGLNAYGANFTGQRFYSPRIAQMMWKNASGQSLPVLLTESNLNGVGGNPTNNHIGTDPRLQSLYGATWLISTLIAGSVENVSGFNYFMLAGPATLSPTLTSRFGGWGFGMTSEGTSDNDTRYAPYWATQMWGPNFPRVSSGVQVTGVDYANARAYAVRNSTSVALMIANRVNVPVTYVVAVAGVNATPSSVRVLDSLSYLEVYNASLRQVVLVKNGERIVGASANPVTLTIQGYGVAVIVESLAKGGIHPMPGMMISPSPGARSGVTPTRPHAVPVPAGTLALVSTPWSATSSNVPLTQLLPAAIGTSSVAVVSILSGRWHVARPNRPPVGGRKP